MFWRNHELAFTIDAKIKLFTRMERNCRCIFIFAITIFQMINHTLCSDHYELQDSTWSRSSSDPASFSHRRSHIGPIPHVNDVMTEWAYWGQWDRCSRSCGGGVRSRTRTCIARYPRVMPGSGIRTSHDRCTGESIQYEVCGTEQCPAGQVSGVSFRAAQCRHYNNRRVLGRVINSWVPYTQGGINPCALVCEGEGEGIVYTFGKVTDGTYCKTDIGTQGLCVNGRCLRLSCDGRLGGAALEDMCRVCGGRNDTCTRHTGVFHSERPSADQPYVISKIGQDDQQALKKPKSFGYHEVAKIPKGSTNVRVLDNSSNFLALKSGEKYLLNGDWLIDWPGEIDAAGASFSYVRKEDQSEALTSLGPTNSDLALMVLLREQNPGIFYEYWTPNNDIRKTLGMPFTPINSTFSNFSTLPSAESLSTTISPTSTYMPTLNPILRSINTKDNLKPAIITGLSLNKSLHHHSPIREDNQLVATTKGMTNADLDSDLHFVNVFKLKKTKTKLPPWESNSVYDHVYPPNNSVYDHVYPPSNLKKPHTHFNKEFKQEHSKTENYNEKKKNKKLKKKKKNKRPLHCEDCLRRKKVKESFCTSDFVSRIQVLNEDVVGEYRRSEALVLQSYKNVVPLLHKEFLWQDLCSCKRLRPGKSYIVMGVTEQGRGNEVKLVLRHESYVRRFSHKVLSRIMKIRQNEMKYCRTWRRHFRTHPKSFLKHLLKKESQNNPASHNETDPTLVFASSIEGI